MLTIMKASAGSGKTYNLAKKYISLLLTNKDMPQFLLTEHQTAPLLHMSHSL